MANVSPEVVLGTPFFTLNDANDNFSGRELWWKTSTTKEALLTTKRIELVGAKEFAAAVLDLESETFVVNIASLSSNVSASSSLLKLNIHLSSRPQAFGLIAEKTLTKVLTEYLDFADIFSFNLASELPKHIGINNHAIELIDGQQLPHRPIYSLEPLELETLKTYIETNLANRFIRPSKSSVGAPILFNRKLDGSLWLY